MAEVYYAAVDNDNSHLHYSTDDWHLFVRTKSVCKKDDVLDASTTISPELLLIYHLAELINR